MVTWGEGEGKRMSSNKHAGKTGDKWEDTGFLSRVIL
jgi:hypothetical protein